MATRDTPGLRIFATESYADWLLFDDPQLAGRVAYDARLEILTRSELSRIVAFRTEHGIDWDRVTRGYGLLVLDPVSDAGAIKLLRRSKGTTVLFRNHSIVVLRRRQQ
jgi:hypothetical protein